MRRQILPLLLPLLLLAACGQTPAPLPEKSSPGATTPGTSTQQALPGVFQIDFGGIGTDTPISRIQSLPSGGLSTQGLVSAPDQFSFSQLAVQTFAVAATGIRHVRVTYKVTNTSSQTLRNPKFVAVVPQGSTTDSVFTNVRYFDGSDASASIDKLSPSQGQIFDASTGNVAADPKANALLTGLDVSQVDTTGKGIKTLTQTGWWLTPPSASGRDNLLAPGDSALITFGVNIPMTSAANGGATKDPFSFSLNVTAVQDALPPVALSSAVKQWDQASQTFWNYVKFPTQTYLQNGTALTRSLPAYYDISTLDNSTTSKVLCGGAAQMSVTNISTASFPNRWRVQLFSQGGHTLKVFEGTTCPATGIPLLSQTVTGVKPSANGTAANYNSTLALKADGTVQSWGDNSRGQLGDGTTTQRTTASAVSTLSGITSITGGGYHALALKADGTVQSWGDNTRGQLGDGSTTTRTSPITVNSLSDIVSIAAGERYSLVLRADGTVWSWGENTRGQLGDGTTTNRLMPVIVSTLNGITSIAGGGNHSLALRADGTVWSWGVNTYGQLGNGTTSNRSTPAAVSGLSGMTSVAGGYQHSLALKADGTVWSWGINDLGQLGDGSTTNRTTPVSVSGLGGVASITGGGVHSVASKTDGTVWSWGSNRDGQLGDAATAQRTRPDVINSLSSITSVTAGLSHSQAVNADGTVQIWGDNAFGQLGDGTTTDRNTPITVSGLSGVARPTP